MVQPRSRSRAGGERGSSVGDYNFVHNLRLDHRQSDLRRRPRRTVRIRALPGEKGMRLATSRALESRFVPSFLAREPALDSLQATTREVHTWAARYPPAQRAVTASATLPRPALPVGFLAPRLLMRDTPVSLRRPGHCLHCEAADTVHLQQAIRGDAVQLHWYCSKCHAEWPVTERSSSLDLPRLETATARRTRSRRSSEFGICPGIGRPAARRRGTTF